MIQRTMNQTSMIVMKLTIYYSNDRHFGPDRDTKLGQHTGQRIRTLATPHVSTVLMMVATWQKVINVQILVAYAIGDLLGQWLFLGFLTDFPRALKTPRPVKQNPWRWQKICIFEDLLVPNPSPQLRNPRLQGFWIHIFRNFLVASTPSREGARKSSPAKILGRYQNQLHCRKKVPPVQLLGPNHVILDEGKYRLRGPKHTSLVFFQIIYMMGIPEDLVV